MRTHFGNYFYRYDHNNHTSFDNGLPKVFKKLEDITARYQTSKDNALQLLDLFFLFRLDPKFDQYHLDLTVDLDVDGFHFPATTDLEFEENVLLNESACLRLYESFILKCQSSLKDAQANFLAQQARVSCIDRWH